MCHVIRFYTVTMIKPPQCPDFLPTLPHQTPIIKTHINQDLWALLPLRLTHHLSSQVVLRPPPIRNASLHGKTPHITNYTIDHSLK